MPHLPVFERVHTLRCCLLLNAIETAMCGCRLYRTGENQKMGWTNRQTNGRIAASLYVLLYLRTEHNKPFAYFIILENLWTFSVYSRRQAACNNHHSYSYVYHWKYSSRQIFWRLKFVNVVAAFVIIIFFFFLKIMVLPTLKAYLFDSSST